ncbi:MAG: substrate-binding domain-containing protein [Thermoleophilia bacterium]|nr:substrate-binding domain-containing protein [Thermoleophilia bacterium]
MGLAVLLLGLAVAAGCGGSDEEPAAPATTEAPPEETEVPPEETEAPPEETEAPPEETVEEPDPVAEAAEAIAFIEGQPSEIPITEPLAALPEGATVAYMQCGVPECAYLAPGFQAAADALGVKLVVIKAGSTAQTIAAAFDSAIQKGVDAILVPALDPITWPKQLEEIKAKDIKVVIWTVPTQEEGLHAASYLTAADYARVATIMANYVIAKSGGAANVVYYRSPEFMVFNDAADAFVATITEKCPGCTIETQDAPVATIGTELPGQVVSYIQRKPETNWVAMAFGSMMIGVPEALEAAGLAENIGSISQAGGPVNYQYIQAGKQTADVTLDYPFFTWMAMDAVARALAGQEIPIVEMDNGLWTSQAPIQILTQPDITFDVNQMWVAYPDFQEYFKGLWGVGG